MESDIRIHIVLLDREGFAPSGWCYQGSAKCCAIFSKSNNRLRPTGDHWVEDGIKREATIAIADIFTEYGREMEARARRILGSDADAEDAVQEAMVSMLRSPHLFAGVERFGAWLFTLIKRRCVDIVRKDTRRKSREAQVGIDDLFEYDDPGELMEKAEFANAVADAVKQLPENQKEAFVQNALKMKTFKEISEATGVPMGTLMARKKTAVDTIRARLNRQGYYL